MSTKFNFEKIIINIILLWGVLLSLIQYLYNRSLWIDEARLALNIIHKNGLELLKPLDYDQMSPVLFLQIEKLFSILIPHSEYGLRLFPLLCYWLSLYLFYRLAKLTFTKPYAIILALTLFVFNSMLIYYSSEVKQYMSDVLVIVAIYYFIVRSYQKGGNKYYIIGVLGAISIFLSNVAPIILFSAGIYLLYECLMNEKNNFKHIAGISIVWVSAILLFYYFFASGHPSRDFMITYWTDRKAFMPQNPFNIDLYIFLLKKVHTIFRYLLPFGIIGEICLLVLFITGFLSLVIKRKTDALILILTPIILHLLLSAFKLYPFYLRLILYISPVVIIVTSFGFGYIIDSIAYLKIRKLRLLAIFLPLLFIFIFFTSGFPLKKEEIKESIKYIQQHISKNNKIYVYYGALPSFTYYNGIEFINISAPVITGSGNRKNNEGYIDELKSLKGRNWILFSHVYADEETNIIKKLDSLGYNKVDAFSTRGSSTYLYDFGD